MGSCRSAQHPGLSPSSQALSLWLSFTDTYDDRFPSFWVLRCSMVWHLQISPSLSCKRCSQGLHLVPKHNTCLPLNAAPCIQGMVEINCKDTAGNTSGLFPLGAIDAASGGQFWCAESLWHTVNLERDLLSAPSTSHNIEWGCMQLVP